MTKLVGFMLLFMSTSSWALVPVEGLLMGSAQSDHQSDPLNFVFSNHYDESQLSENNKIKLYHNTYKRGQQLGESCSYLGNVRYPTPWQQTQARRTIVATLQYLGLDVSVKAMGAYARKLEISEDQYKQLTANILSNYCSNNITVYSLKYISASLDYYYKNPSPSSIPSVETSPFATTNVKNKSESSEARSREFEQVIKNFRAFCSWGGDIEDYRMLSPYLKNRYIMAFVNNNLSGIKDEVDQKSLKVAPGKTNDSVQVVCKDLICRKDTFSNFKNTFPLSLGSTGIDTDTAKNYCHHFRYLEYSSVSTIPEVKKWIKIEELEGPIMETSMFISLMTGVPDLLFAADTYQEIPLLIKSSIDDRWAQWAKSVLETFSRSLLYEESLKIAIQPRRNIINLRSEGFKVDLNVTLGEMDRLVQDNDKLKLSFDLKLSRNFLHSLRTKWNALEKEIDIEGQKNYKMEIAKYLDLQLVEKKSLFTQKVWDENFSKLLAEELIGQAMAYEGSLFDSYTDHIIKVPVKFSYGMFALSYLRNRSDFSSGKYKLNL